MDAFMQSLLKAIDIQQNDGIGCQQLQGASAICCKSQWPPHEHLLSAYSDIVRSTTLPPGDMLRSWEWASGAVPESWQ